MVTTVKFGLLNGIYKLAYGVTITFGLLNEIYMCLSAQGVKYSGLLSLLLMRLATCGLQHKKLASNLSHTTRHLLLHLQSKMDPRQDRLFLMFIFMSSHAKVVILKRKMRFMMLWT